MRPSYVRQLSQQYINLRDSIWEIVISYQQFGILNIMKADTRFVRTNVNPFTQVEINFEVNFDRVYY